MQNEGCVKDMLCVGELGCKGNFFFLSVKIFSLDFQKNNDCKRCLNDHFALIPTGLVGIEGWRMPHISLYILYFR